MTQPKKPRKAKAKAKAEAKAEEAPEAEEKTTDAGAKASTAEPKKPRGRRKAAAAKADAPAEKAAVAKPAAKAKAKAKPKAAKAQKPGKASAEVTETAPASPRRPRRGDRSPGGPPVVRAQARYVRSSARKARLVSDHIRGRSVEEARAILEFTPRAVAQDWRKLLESAVANAEHNHELVGDELRIKDIYADEGPTLKRFRPRAMGRATKIRKRTTHLTITLTPPKD